jgi:hypothetical protein
MSDNDAAIHPGLLSLRARTPTTLRKSSKKYSGIQGPWASCGLRFFDPTGIVRVRTTLPVEDTWQIDWQQKQSACSGWCSPAAGARS